MQEAAAIWLAGRLNGATFSSRSAPGGLALAIAALGAPFQPLAFILTSQHRLDAVAFPLHLGSRLTVSGRDNATFDSPRWGIVILCVALKMSTAAASGELPTAP